METQCLTLGWGYPILGDESFIDLNELRSVDVFLVPPETWEYKKYLSDGKSLATGNNIIFKWNN